MEMRFSYPESSLRENMGIFAKVLINQIDDMNLTMTIQVTSKRALRLLQELEKLKIIKVIRENRAKSETDLSEKYLGTFSESDAESFDDHTISMREEWKNNLCT